MQRRGEGSDRKTLLTFEAGEDRASARVDESPENPIQILMLIVHHVVNCTAASPGRQPTNPAGHRVAFPSVATPKRRWRLGPNAGDSVNRRYPVAPALNAPHEREAGHKYYTIANAAYQVI